MNRAARRARRTLAEAERELEATIAARNSLLDVLNAILFLEGGRVVVPQNVVVASTRKPIHVTQRDDRFIIEFMGEEQAEPTKPSVIERLKRLGLKPV